MRETEHRNNQKDAAVSTLGSHAKGISVGQLRLITWMKYVMQQDAAGVPCTQKYICKKENRTMPDGVATEKRLITAESINEYLCYLCEQEKSQATVEKYQRDIKALMGFLNNRPVSKQLMVAWKQHLAETYAVASVNSMLAAANSFMDFIGWPEYKIKAMKVQKKLFCSPDKELTKDEYYRLVHTAMRIGKERLCLVIQTIGATGIRISELKFITVEAVASGRAIVNNKGKTRVVLLPTVTVKHQDTGAIKRPPLQFKWRHWPCRRLARTRAKIFQRARGYAYPGLARF